MAADGTEPTLPDIAPMVTSEVVGRELSLRAVTLGIVLAAIFGIANAYLGLTVAVTVSATFPAAVLSIAAFRLPFFRGGVLEQNIARTTATVGEALVAAAIFTIPAFVMVDLEGQRLWTDFNYWQSTLILLIGGLLGIFFIIFMRRILTVEAKLPFPESYACYELVKAGQGGESGAKYLFGALGLGMLIELLKNEHGLTIFQAMKEFPISLPGAEVKIPFSTPTASPAILSVGYIIGPRFAAVAFSGGALAWLVLTPLALLMRHEPLGPTEDWMAAAAAAARLQIRPIAVGAMLVASLYTLWGLRQPIAAAFRGIFRAHPRETAVAPGGRREQDLNLKLVFCCSLLLAIPMGFLFYSWTGHPLATAVATLLTMGLGFLLAIIGAWLVGMIGSSNQPVSGITLVAIILTGIGMVLCKVVGLQGIAVSLGVAVVICSAAALSGTLIQELKVGQFIGATPWKMELAQVVSAVVVASVVIFAMVLLHKSNLHTGGTGIGDKRLPGVQAGLMAQVATGIITGKIAWHLVALGMCLALVFILMGAPLPMLIAVGMYLPLDTSFAIFVGGLMRWLLDRRVRRYQIGSPAKERVENTGVLLASGFIAGEAITGVVIAGLVILFMGLAESFPSQWAHLADAPSLTMFCFHTEAFPFVARYGWWLALLIFGIVAGALIWLPLKARRS